MTCPVMYTVTCLALRAIGSHAVSTVTGGFFAQLAAGVRDGITWIFTNSTDFWVRLPSPDLDSEPAIGAMQQWLLPITAAVAVGGMIAAGLRMVLTRKANPLLDAGTGLAAIAAVGTLGVIVPDLLLRAGDAWSNWVLQKSTGGEFTTRMSQILSLGAAPDAIVVVLGVVAMLLGAVQAALMLFRQAAILILAAVLPMAAAGATAPLTRSWIRKIVSWMLALICYKPAAAAVYAAAFTMIGTGTTLRTTLMGFVMIVLSLVAMPVLMRFFTWTTGTVASGGGGGQLLGMTATGAVAMGAMRGGTGGASASEHASYLSSRQSPPAAGPDGAATDPPSPRASGSGSGTAGGGGGAGAGRPQVPGGGGLGGDAGPSSGMAAGDANGGASGAGLAGSRASGAGGAGVAGRGAGSTAAGAAGPVAAAILAGQALANGARDAAAGAAGEGDRR